MQTQRQQTESETSPLYTPDYERLVAALPAAMYVYSTTRGGLYYSPAVERILGYSPARLLAHPFLWNESIHPDDHLTVEKTLAALPETRSFTLEYRFRHAAGRWVWLHDQSLHVDERGNELLVSGVAWDVTYSRAAREAERRFIDRIVTAQEEERRRIARELHDRSSQGLSALSMGLQWVLTRCELPSQARDRLAEMERLVQDLARAAERLAWELRPPALDALGLEAALWQLTRRWTRQTGIPVQFNWHLVPGQRLDPATETVLYRIVQEALTNVARHAKASLASVLVYPAEHDAVAIVEDNGRGFDVADDLTEPGVGRPSLGLLGMRERAELVGGTLSIESVRNAGTTIIARLPQARRDPHEQDLRKEEDGSSGAREEDDPNPDRGGPRRRAGGAATAD